MTPCSVDRSVRAKPPNSSGPYVAALGKCWLKRMRDGKVLSAYTAIERRKEGDSVVVPIE